MKGNTTDDLIAAFLAKGGQVRKCPPGRAMAVKAESEEEREINRTRRQTAAYMVRFEALQEGITVKRSVDEWAAHNIKACDPYREIAEAAALVVICRDEGGESARLFEKELTWGGAR
jgi:hypothetical protein